MIKSYSQASQDQFISFFNNFKRNGTFVEIGTNHPIWGNNTYILETHFNWRGLLVEYSNQFESEYKKLRKNSVYKICDARKIDYVSFFQENLLPSNIDYLQIDLDVDNRSTLDVLEIFDKFIFPEYKFATVTFEHDIYTGDFFETRQKSRQIFNKHGYELVFPDVMVNLFDQYHPFEDWYCHPSLIENKLIDKFKTDKSLPDKEIMKLLNNV